MTTKRIISFILILCLVATLLASCTAMSPATKLEITNGETITIELFESVKLKAKTDGALPAAVSWSASNTNVHVSDKGQDILEQIDSYYGTNTASSDIASLTRDFILGRLNDICGIKFVDVFNEY